MNNSDVWDRLTWAVVGPLAITAFLLGFVGFWIEFPLGGDGDTTVWPAHLLNNLWRSAALFVFVSEIEPDQSWFMVIARVLAPLATLGGVYASLLTISPHACTGGAWPGCATTSCSSDLAGGDAASSPAAPTPLPRSTLRIPLLNHVSQG